MHGQPASQPSNPAPASAGAPELGGAGEGGARGLLDGRRLHGAGGLLSRTVQCKPVVDVLQDLTAVRCFGLSEHTKARIADFGGIAELVRYYENTVDAFACNTSYSAECTACRLRETRECNGGCLAFKVTGILELRAAAERAAAAVVMRRLLEADDQRAHLGQAKPVRHAAAQHAALGGGLLSLVEHGKPP